MPKNKLSDLRNHLFTVLEELTEANSSDYNLPAKIEKSKAVAEVAQTIINSAKVEVDYLRATNQGEDARSEFIDVKETKPALSVATRHALPPPSTNGNGHGELKKGLSTGKNLGAEIQ